eukprot:Lithocolla_globosa_v1_NODE_161_length_5591_cov_403.883192.p5 type:complete len:108 gc:universal NODE_161_length_5591_cov_403.883192:1136-1459(+)
MVSRYCVLALLSKLLHTIAQVKVPNSEIREAIADMLETSFLGSVSLRPGVSIILSSRHPSSSESWKYKRIISHSAVQESISSPSLNNSFLNCVVGSFARKLPNVDFP